MNIFVVHSDPQIAAQSLCDKHIVKMPLETAQILCNVAHRHEYSDIPYRSVSTKHPCVLWAGTTRQNWEWLVIHGLALCEEYTRRYEKRHKSQDVIEWALQSQAAPPDGELQPFVLAMPEQYKSEDAVQSYRAYYLGEKMPFATWKAPAKPPLWWEKAINSDFLKEDRELESPYTLVGG